MKNKRDRMDVIYDILNSVQKSQTGIKITHLLYKSNLSYKLLNDYIEELKDAGLIEEREEKTRRRAKRPNKLIIITENGGLFLMELRKMKKFIESFGL